MNSSTPKIDLPSPEPEALAHSERLAERLVAAIDQDGPLPLDRYWQMVMYEPALGYYSAGTAKFGEAGDFITAPELGAVFSRCLASPVAATLDELGQDDMGQGEMGQGDVLELGAGSGVMAADLLAELEQRGRLPERYLILEVSAELRQRQRDTLVHRVPRLATRVQWLDRVPDRDWSGVIIGNEVIDALPARRFQLTDQGWQELCVDHRQGVLGWSPRPAADHHRDYLTGIQRALDAELAPGYICEIQPQLGAWAQATTARLKRGRVLLIDYGYPRQEYFLPQRHMGTLICHYRHRAHYDPFLWPGLNDLSVSVEFTALAEALDEAGLSVEGFTSQVQFLIGCGLGTVVGEATEAITDYRIEVMHEVKQLTLPSEMGVRFQALSAARGLERSPPPGFQTENRLDRL